MIILAVAATAYWVERTLRARAGADVVAPDSVDDFIVGRAGVTARLGSGRSIHARLLVAADGGRSRLRAAAVDVLGRCGYAPRPGGGDG